MEFRSAKGKFAVIVALLFAAPTAWAGSSVVTAAENKQKLEADDVRQIFKGDVQRWENGKAIVIVVPDLASPEGEKMLDKVFGMSAKEYKKYWMQKVFKGEAATPPDVKAGDSLKQFLKAYPNAIGVLPDEMVDASVRKVLALN